MSFDYDTLPMPPVSESVGSSVVNASYGGLEISEGPLMVDYSFVDLENLNEPPQLVEGILHEGCKLAIGGRSKSGKTWLAMQLSLCVSHGRDFMGHEVEKVPVCYINLEVRDFALNERIRRMIEALELELEEGQLHIVNARGGWNGIKSLKGMIPELIEKGVKLIVVDPLYKLESIDENNTQDMGNLLRELDQVVEETGASLAYVHHYRKSGSKDNHMDQLAGSGLVGRDFDSFLGIHRDKSGDSVLSSGKLVPILRNHAPLTDIPVSWEHPLLLRDDSDSPFVSHNASKKHFPQDILAHMRSGEEYRSGDLRKATGMGRTVFSENLKVLVADGRVVSPKRGFYKLPEEESNEEE
jgi:hypothetical protein